MIAAMTGTNMKPTIPAMRVTMLLQLNLENSMFSKNKPCAFERDAQGYYRL